ncbi:uncharacterized protein C2orf73 homolog [Monodelphis domestica]|uniref:Uncharacterized protein n=1 Tax=Monodelphis domestica TaxID=13616 RepID=F7G396_MONDO|nr:uncharacterized protein C2orf73 homolog [Monodelphis domestica]
MPQTLSLPMTPSQIFESPKSDKTEDNLASSEEEVRTDNLKTSDVHLPDIVEKKENDKSEKEPEKAEQHSENTFVRRPHVMYAKFIRTNARSYNEPVCYIENPDMRGIQEDWWTQRTIVEHHCVPAYDTQTTQRNDFKVPACQLVLPTKYSSKQKPACGIVPLAITDQLPVLQTRISGHFPFIHRFDIRKSTSSCMRPKRHGAFLQPEVPPTRGSTNPSGKEAFAPGSRLPEQARIEKGHSSSSSTSSTCLYQPHSQRSLMSENHLSETDSKEGAKANLTPPGKETRSPHISLTDEANYLPPTQEDSLYSLSK